MDWAVPPAGRHLASWLKGRTVESLADRAWQLLRAEAERAGLVPGSDVQPVETFLERLGVGTEGRRVDPSVALEAFRRRADRSHLPGLRDREATVAAVRSAEPGHEERIVGWADRVREGRFDLLGYRGLHFGTPVDWHLDPVNGTRAPDEHWSRVDFLDPTQAGDHKVIWELNRHHHLVTLGQAYWLAGDKSYAETFVRHTSGWMESNPPKQGVNWASSLELAFRIVAWTWALHLFRRSPALEPAHYCRMLQFLELKGRHVEAYLSTHFSPNTHLTGEALGLIYLGGFFPELPRAARWRRLGVDVLLDELDHQVGGDGVHFEGSTYYHRYTAEIYAHLVVLARTGAIALSDDREQELEKRVEALFDVLLHVVRPDGKAPLVGDDDGGRVLFLDRREIDELRPDLGAGAALFSRPDLLYASRGAHADAVWLLGPSGRQELDTLTPRARDAGSRRFGEGGFVVMRDGWARDASYALVRCGPHGALKGGHAHADQLSLELVLRGSPVLVDPGTGSYTADPEVRETLRSTGAHSTVTVAGESSSVPAGPFSWARTATGHLEVWHDRERFDFLRGSHDGYARLDPPAWHTRELFFLKGGYVALADRVDPAGAHPAELHFRFAPGLRLRPTRRDVTVLRQVEEEEPRPVSRLAVSGAGGPTLGHGPSSRVYGSVESAPVARFPLEESGLALSVLVPPGYTASELDGVTGGRALRVIGESVDYLLLRTATEVDGSGLTSDFDWTWCRTDGADGCLREVICVGGRHLALGGRTLVEAEEPVAWLAVRVEEDRMHVASSAAEGVRFGDLVGSRIRPGGGVVAGPPLERA